MRTRGAILIVCACALVACEGRGPGVGPASGSDAPRPTTVKRLTASIAGDAFTFYNKLNFGNGVAGIEILEDMTSAGLANFDNTNQLRPQLGQTVPTLENGLWEVLPDGHMSLTWQIRQGAAWQDGTPVTAADVVFTATVARDPEVPTLREPLLDNLEAIDSPDPSTVVLRWRQPFVDADRLFTRLLVLPLPSHLLQAAYTEDKARFVDHAYWAGDFVHAGPFRVRELVRGSHVLLDANDAYVLGRPKIDVIEVKFIPDAQTLVASVLSGTVELTLGGRNISIDQAVEVRDRWPDGRMEHAPVTTLRIYPQFTNPDPPIVANVQFRRALMHAIDRQEMIQTFLFGLVPVTDSILPDVPRFREVNASLPRYGYDVVRAGQFIEGLGYAQGGDGFFRDAAGQRLTVELRARGDEERVLAAIADYWRRAGVGTETVAVPPQRNQDRAYRFERPAFHMTGGTSGLDGMLKAFPSSQIPTPARGYVGSNDSHYSNPDMDALIDRYRVTIPQSERMALVGQIIRLAVEDLAIMNLYFTVEPMLIHNRIDKVGPRSDQSTQGWNAEQWDVR